MSSHFLFIFIFNSSDIFGEGKQRNYCLIFPEIWYHDCNGWLKVRLSNFWRNRVLLWKNFTWKLPVETFKITMIPQHTIPDHTSQIFHLIIISLVIVSAFLLRIKKNFQVERFCYWFSPTAFRCKKFQALIAFDLLYAQGLVLGSEQSFFLLLTAWCSHFFL